MSYKKTNIIFKLNLTRKTKFQIKRNSNKYLKVSSDKNNDISWAKESCCAGILCVSNMKSWRDGSWICFQDQAYSRVWTIVWTFIKTVRTPSGPTPHLQPPLHQQDIAARKPRLPETNSIQGHWSMSGCWRHMNSGVFTCRTPSEPSGCVQSGLCFTATISFPPPVGKPATTWTSKVLHLRNRNTTGVQHP